MGGVIRWSPMAVVLGACIAGELGGERTGQAQAQLCSPLPPCEAGADIKLELGAPVDEWTGIRSRAYGQAAPDSTVYAQGINPEKSDADKAALWWGLESNYQSAGGDHFAEAYVQWYSADGSASLRPIMVRIVRETLDTRLTFRADDVLFMDRTGSAEVGRFRGNGEFRVNGFVRLWAGASIQAKASTGFRTLVSLTGNDELELGGGGVPTRVSGAWACNGRTPQSPAAITGETTAEQLAEVIAALRANGILTP